MAAPRRKGIQSTAGCPNQSIQGGIFDRHRVKYLAEVIAKLYDQSSYMMAFVLYGKVFEYQRKLLFYKVM